MDKAATLSESASSAASIKFPLTLLAVAFFATQAVLVLMAAYSYHAYQDRQETIERRSRLYALQGKITHLDEVLTMSARMAVATGDPVWEERYLNFEPKLDRAVKEAIDLAPASYSGLAAKKTDAANQKLVSMEKRAFELLHTGQRVEANALIFGPEYQAQKLIYSTGMEEFSSGLSVNIKSDLEREQQLALLALIAVAIVIPLLIASWLVLYRAAGRWRLLVTDTNLELRQLNQSLDERVVKRTRQLDASLEALQSSQKELGCRTLILDMISKGMELNSILEALIDQLERNHPGMLCSVVLLDIHKRRLSSCIAPSLPEYFKEAFEGLETGDRDGLWGSALVRKERTFVENMMVDPYWEPFQAEVKKAGLHACWLQPIRSPQGEIIGNFALYFRESKKPVETDLRAMDIAVKLSELAVSRHQTLESLKKLSLAVEHSPNVVFITDANGVIEYVNHQFTTVTGYSADEAVGHTPKLFYSEKTELSVYREQKNALLAGKQWRGEICHRKKNAEHYWAREDISPIFDIDGVITHYVSNHQDITEVRRISEEIRYQASHDTLTGLINRRAFEACLQQSLAAAKRDRSEHTLCFLDLDQFKVVNDSCGHIAGDELLRQVCNLLRNNLRKADTLARLGGDEFTILMTCCSLEHASRAGYKIIELLKDFRFHWQGQVFSVGVSIGMASINENTHDTAEALREADTACYIAKEAGRNRIHTFKEDDALQALRNNNIQWAHEIREALDSDRFLLYAQPIVPLQEENRGLCYEILLRMKKTDGQLVAPGLFMPAAEQYNYSVAIDRWVIDHTLGWIAENADQLQHVADISINLSGQSLGDETLLRHIIKLLDADLVPGSKIKFEITETAAIANLSAAKTFIQNLREYGCKFALDDFGSGLSSFAYLKNLPVQVLKIDGMFVKNITTDPIDDAMVRSINEIGHVMGMVTIAEFVEDDAIRERLREIGVDYGQGYGICRPAPIECMLSETTANSDTASAEALPV